MKVGIIGHTSGIGKALYAVFDDVVGYSRSNGYDINDYMPYIDEIADSVDVLIINAHSGFKQVEMLYDMWERWVDKDKIIVCISSQSGDNLWSNSYPYSVHKSALDEACKQLSRFNGRCKLLNVRPGYVDTPRVSLVEKDKIDAVELAKFIKVMVQMDGTMWVSNVTLKPM